MIICEYCQTQLPGHSLFCCQCGGKVHLPDETLVSANSGSSIRSALTQKYRTATQYAGPGSPHNGKLEHELHQTYKNGDFNNPAVAENGIYVTWEEDEDDTWI